MVVGDKVYLGCGIGNWVRGLGCYPWIVIGGMRKMMMHGFGDQVEGEDLDMDWENFPGSIFSSPFPSSPVKIDPNFSTKLLMIR